MGGKEKEKDRTVREHVNLKSTPQSNTPTPTGRLKSRGQPITALLVRSPLPHYFPHNDLSFLSFKKKKSFFFL
jgi:hypothetical protein